MKNLSFFLILLFLSLNVSAQEIGISLVKIWTQNEEIQDPLGIGVNLSADIWRVRLKFEYIHAKNERSYFGYITSGFMQYPSPYVLENVKCTSYYSAYEFSINLPSVVHYEEYGLAIGLGMTFDKFTVTRLGSTSGKTTSKFNDETKYGPFFAASISRDHFFWTPLKLELLYKVKSLSNGYYATDVELPFADIKKVHELQLNLMYNFRSDAP